MSPVRYNPRQLYARGRCGYAGGMDFYPVGRWVGEGTAGPVWRAYASAGGVRPGSGLRPAPSTGWKNTGKPATKILADSKVL